MCRIIAMVGPSGSGKSTRAKELMTSLKEEGEDVIIVGRDKLREMCFSFTESNVKEYYQHKDVGIHEYMVSEISDTIIKQALKENKTVIVDNTHLRAKYLKELWKYGVPVTYDVLITPLEDCIKRDKERVRQVGEEIIRKQYVDCENLLKTFDFAANYTVSTEIIKQDKSLPEAFIFDIDGTLAQMKGRSPYDMSRVKEDSLKVPIYKAYKAAKEAGYKIIICTGREGSPGGQGLTMEWLAENDIAYDEFYIRPEGSNEADWKIKEEMWRDIIKDYYIVAMYDDRNQVVEHARKKGFTVFQVAEGNF